MGMGWLMRTLLKTIFILFIATNVYAQSGPPMGIQDEGGSISRPVNNIDCVGAGISCTFSVNKATLSVSGGGAGNSFETMTTPSGTSPVADASDDTLLWIAGNGITITGDSSADSIQISATVDTNAALACSGTTTYYDGEGNCDDISSVYEAADAAITKTDEAETISANWVNTANPWDFSDETNATGGRSVTLSDDAIVADAELYTWEKSFAITGMNEGWDQYVQISVPSAVTISEINCSTDANTASVTFYYNAPTTPNTNGKGVLRTALPEGIVCDTDEQVETTFNDAFVTAGSLISMDILSMATTPSVLRVHMKGSYDD